MSSSKGKRHHNNSDEEKDKRKRVDASSSSSGEESDNNGSDSQDNSDSGSDSDTSLGENEHVDIDFEFFDPKPEDFHSLKRLLQGGFGDDAEDFDISALADLILDQKTIGSTVKMETNGEPYALFTVLNMQHHKETKVMQQISAYLLKKAGAKREKLREILESHTVGLLFNERVVNMPPQIVPPMLRMLMEELEWAVEDGEPYNFDYYLILAPMYKETEELEGGGRKVGLDAFVHAEDEFIEEFAGIKFDYKFTRSKRVADSRNSFADTGLAPSRRCLVVHKSKVKDMIKRVESVLEG